MNLLKAQYKSYFLRYWLLLWVVFGSLFSGEVSAQSLSNFKQIEFPLVSDTLYLKVFNINSSTLRITNDLGQTISKSTYTYVSSANCIVFSQKPQGAKVRVSYRAFPFSLNQPSYSHLYKYGNASKDKPLENRKIDFYTEEKVDLASYSRLNKTGYLSRGIGFGNNQDVIVNSALNLQLDGYLTQNIKIKAAITDNNIPIQPEGNTQTIQEFDKVSITLYNEHNSLTLGDFEIAKPQGYFLNANKKLMGAKYRFQKTFKKDRSLSTMFAGAVAKGKFNRMKIQGKEGVQGPYRLVGSNNESYIIVLSGTEKVYINGERMQRGEAFDYVIDYNLAQVQFTTMRPITKDDRIIIEFEYSDKNYTKFTSASYTDFHAKNVHLWLNVLSDHESKNQPVNADYSDTELQALEQAGDNPFRAITTGIDSLGFSSSEIRYQMVDSLGYDSVLVYSKNPKTALYRVVFSFVGEHKGDYRPAEKNLANGKVFEWIPPDANGRKQGSYSPIKLLIPARSHQLMTSGAHLYFKTYTQLWVEAALSNYNKNTFSNIDQKDNVGWAYKLKLQQDILTKDTSRTYLRLLLENENVGDHFAPFNSFRSVEHERDWNYDFQLGQKTMDYGAGISWKQNNKWQSMYRFNRLEVKDYEALMHRFKAQLNQSKLNLNIQASYLLSDYKNINNHFFRTSSHLRYTLLKNLTVGLEELSEHNTFRDTASVLRNNSYAFFEWNAFTDWQFKGNNTVKFNYKHRLDQSVYKAIMGKGSLGRSFSLSTDINSLKSQKINMNMTWRRLTILDSSRVADTQNEDYFLGHLKHRIKGFKNAISLNTLYEISSGLELKKEFTYVEVPAGQGVYQWIDYNKDSVQQLNEFEVAKYADQKKFVRVNVSGNEYVRVFTNEWSEVLSLNPYKIWRNKKGWKGIVAKFSDVLVLKTKHKIRNSEIADILNPLNNKDIDSSLVSMNQTLRNTFSFNKIHSVFGIDYIYTHNKNKSLLINGFNLRTLQSHSLNGRFNINRTYSLNNQLKYTNKQFLSDFFEQNNYKIKKWSNTFDLTVHINTHFRLSGHYTYKEKKNRLGEEKVYLNELGAEMKYNLVERSNLQVNVDYFLFKYNAQPNTPVAFEMLEGLQPGNNMSWSVLYQTQISKYLQLNISYFGRYSKDNPIVHNGQFQLRAVF